MSLIWRLYWGILTLILLWEIGQSTLNIFKYLRIPDIGKDAAVARQGGGFKEIDQGRFSSV